MFLIECEKTKAENTIAEVLEKLQKKEENHIARLKSKRAEHRSLAREIIAIDQRLKQEFMQEVEDKRQHKEAANELKLQKQALKKESEKQRLINQKLDERERLMDKLYQTFDIKNSENLTEEIVDQLNPALQTQDALEMNIKVLLQDYLKLLSHKATLDQKLSEIKSIHEERNCAELVMKQKEYSTREEQIERLLGKQAFLKEHLQTNVKLLQGLSANVMQLCKNVDSVGRRQILGTTILDAETANVQIL